MRTRWTHRAAAAVSRIVASAALGALAPAASAQDTEVSPHEPALRLIEQAVTPQRDDSHLGMLLALRQLRDPALRPMFEQLVSSRDWRLQAHAALGLAELDPQQRIDPAILARLGPLAQESVIATALDLDFIKPDQIGKLLAFQNLHPIARLLLSASLIGEESLKVDVGSVEELAASEDHLISGLASAMLAQLDRPQAFAAFEKRLAGLPGRERQTVSMWLLDAVRRYRLDAVRDWIHFIIENPESPDALHAKAVFTQASLGGAAGIETWEEYARRDSGYNHRVRSLLMLLASRAPAPIETLESLRSPPGEPLVDRLIDAAIAISEQRDAAESIIELLRLNHAKTNDWIMEYCGDLPKAQAARVYRFMIERVDSLDSGSAQRQPETLALAARAASDLFSIDPEAVEASLRSAKDDSMLQEVILLGLLETHSPRASVAAAVLPRLGAGRADSLALLLASRQLAPRNDVDKLRLRTIAAGGARISDPLRAQAAWLYLKHTGQADRALDRALANRH